MKEISFGESCIGFVSVEACMSVDVVCFIHISILFFGASVTEGVGQRPSNPQFCWILVGSDWWKGSYGFVWLEIKYK
jgi:hypothetical protein